MAQCDEYRNATAQLLLRALWHPWRTRWRMQTRLRALGVGVDALHRGQEAAMTVLAGPARRDALAEQLAPGQ
ncbi:hypothetical protein SAMN05216223_13527 [Actinacidiphila yanglinensis]|uniref:Uncharacterized protein n=1 Tax=Actinacidiphila yanglinensis TaxID=310779 RepID=A0A1H6EF57_9ACTN|nr:hypothetical protein SAMN05216223_13527 [Actinacidiphila yanglinensis]